MTSRHPVGAFMLRRSLITGMMAAASPLAIGQALAQVVAVAGGPTTVTPGANGGPTTVTTTRVNNSAGLNTFTQFDVAQAQTVNLMLPTNAVSLVNVVRDSKVNIDGIVNSYKDGKIGGRVYFVAPQGFMVGATGVLNIGSLTVATPTTDFTDDLIDNFATDTDRVNGLGGLVTGAVNQIVAPLSADGSIVIAPGAKINAYGGVTLRSRAIEVGAGAAISAGQRGYAAFAATVNAADIPSATVLVEHGGRIALVAEETSAGEVWDRDAQATIDVGGKLYGDDIKLTATATADASVAAESAETAVSELPGLLAGISGSYVHADTRASIDIRQTAVLDSTGDITLAAKTTASTTSTLPDIALGGTIALAVTYAELDAHATIDVASGAALTAGGDLSLSAFNAASLGASAISIASPGETAAGADAAAVGLADITATIDVAAGVALALDGKVTAQAQNDVEIGVDATAYAAGDSPAGVVVAYADVEDAATAKFSADLGSSGARAEELIVSAVSNTTKNNVKAATDVGPTVANKVINLLPSPQGAIAGKLQANAASLPKFDGGLGDVQSTTDADGNATGSGNVKSTGRFGSALSIAVQKHEATAKIGDGGVAPAIYTTGDVVVAAKTYDAPIHSKAASAVGSSNTTADKPTNYGISAAVAYGDYTHTTEATIAAGAVVDADRIAVNALTDVPVEITWQKWDSPSAIIAHLNGDLGIANTIANGWANATGEADKLGISGSVSLQFMDNTTFAWVGAGAALTSNAINIPSIADKPADSWLQRIDDDWVLSPVGGVSVAAETLTGAIQIAGNISITLQGTGNDKGSGTAVGGSVLNVEHKNTTIAGIDADAVVDSGTSLNVAARASDFALLVTPSAGRGASISATGMVGRFASDNTTHAVISNTAAVSAPKVSLNADQTIKVVNVAAAITLSAQDVAIGAGIALNDIIGDTQAFVGDVSLDSARLNDEVAAIGTSVGRIETDALDVLAGTDGYIVVAGAAGGAVSNKNAQTNEADLPANGQDTGAEGAETPSIGLVDKGVNLAKTGINKIATKIGASGTKVAEALKTSSSSSAPTLSISAMGSFAYNDTELTTKAFLAGANVAARASAGGVDTSVTAVSAPYLMSGAGAGAKMAPSAEASASAAIAGSFTLDVSKNRAEAAIIDSVITDAGATDVRALNGGLRGSVALGMAIVQQGGSQSGAGAGALSLLLNEDSASATIARSSITGKAGLSGRDVTVQAYNAAYMGAGGGAGYSGGQGGLGLSATVLSATDPDDLAATEAAIIDSSLRAVDQITVDAADAAVMVGLAASVGVGSEKFGAQGSGVYADLARTTRATVQGSTITASGLTVASSGQRNSALDSQLLDGAPTAASVSGYDFDRGGLDADTPQNADGDALAIGSGDGAMVVLFAGQIGQGKNVVGLSFAGAEIANAHEALVDNSTISLGSGALAVDASEDAIMVGATVGVSAGGDKFAGAGSITLLQSATRTTATIGGTGSTRIDAGTVNVEATNASTLAGLSGAFSGGGKVAVGASVTAVTAADVTRATVQDAAINATSALDVEAAQRGLYVDLALAGAGGDNVGVGGAGTINLIGNGTQARVSGVHMMQPAADVSVRAFDDSAIYTASLGMGYGQRAGIGAAIVVNTLTDPDEGAHVSAIVDDSRLDARNVLVAADSESEVVAVAIGIGGSTNAGVGGSLVVNKRDYDVRALIRDNADITAQNNIGVLASTRDVMTAAAGGVGVAAQGAGVGVTGVINLLGGETEAAVTGGGTRVNALGKSASDTLTIYTGALSDTPDMGAITSADDFVLDDFSLATRTVMGLAVNALSKQRTSIVSMGFGAAATGAGIGANFSMTQGTGRTLAHIDAARINDSNGGAGAMQAVDITAADHSYMANLVVAGALAGQGAGVAGAANVNVFEHDVAAYSDNARITAAGAVRIGAESSQRILGLTAGLGGGFVGGAASLSVTTFDADTSAYARGGTVTAGSLDVAAVNAIGDNLNAGSIAGGVVAGAAAVSVIKSDNDTFAGIGRATAGGASLQTKIRADAVDVRAARTADHHLHTVGGAGGGGALAGMGTILLMTDSTEAGVYRTDLAATNGDDATRVTVDARETVDADLVTGALAAGGTMGLGASVGVLSSSTSVGAVIADQSDIRAANVSVLADSTKDYRSILATAGIGGQIGAAATAGVILVGNGAAQSGGGDTDGGDIIDGATGMLADGAGLDIDAYAETLSQDERTALGTSSSYDAPDAGESYAPSAVLAKVAGSRIRAAALGVDANDRIGTEQHVGSLAGGGVGVGAGVGYTGVSTAVTAAIDSASQIDAGDVAVTAATGDVAADKQAGEVYAYVGAGGGFALGAAASVVQLDSAVTASVGGDIRGHGGADDVLAIRAEDATSLTTDTYNGVVAGIAGGLVVSVGQKTGSVTADLAPAGATRATTVRDFARVSIDAITAGRIDTSGVAAAGGAFGAATGLYVLGQDDSDTRARLGAATITSAPGGVSVNALATPDVDVEIIAATLSAGVSAGASVGEAKITGSVKAETAANAIVTGATPLTVKARMGLADDRMSAESKVSVGVGGWLAAVNATVALTENSSEIEASVGEALTAGSGALSVIAERETRQRAETTGVTVGGFVAAGGNVSQTDLGGHIHATVGKGLHTAPGVALGDITVRAGTGVATIGAAATTASEYAEAKAVSGSGSAIAVAAGQADVTVDTDVYAGFAGASSATTTNASGAITVLADYAVTGDSRASTLQAALAGGSGALANRDFNTVVTAEIGDYIVLTGADVTVLARQTNISSDSGTDTGAGGALNANAGISHTNFNADTRVRIGDGARVAALGDGGDLKLLAANTAIGEDTSTMATGGLIQVPVTEAISTSDLRQSVSIGDNAALLALDRLIVGSYGVADIVTNVRVSTYGAVSTAVGIANSDLAQTNTVSVGANSTIDAGGDIVLAAGRSGDGFTDSVMGARAYSDVYNWTVIPLTTYAEAEANNDSTSTLTLGTNSRITSLGDVALSAFDPEGALVASGRTHNPYLAALSIEEESGKTDDRHASTITLGGSVLAGAKAKQSIAVDASGALSFGVDTSSELARLVTDYVPYDEMQLRIDVLTLQRAAPGLTGDQIASIDASIGALERTQANMPSHLVGSTRVGDAVTALQVQVITAKAGDISVEADTLTAPGAASLKAIGGAEIKITSATDAYLVTGNLTIPETHAIGGRVTFSGGATAAGLGTLSVQAIDGGVLPRIEIANTSGTGSPYILMGGAVSNYGGSVNISNDRGDIAMFGTLFARQVNISAPLGNYVFNNADAYYPVGSAPESLWSSARLIQPGSSARDIVGFIASKAFDDGDDTTADLNHDLLYGDAAARIFGYDSEANTWNGDDWRSARIMLLFDLPNPTRSYDSSYTRYYDSDFHFSTVAAQAIDKAVASAAGVYPGGSSIRAETVEINAAYLDINAPVIAGRANRHGVTIGSAARSVMDQWDKMYAAGTISGGLRDLTGSTQLTSGATTKVATGYDVATKQIVVGDFEAAGGGAIYLTGRIVSTNPTGSLQVNNGAGKVDIVNATDRTLAVGDISTGQDLRGLIRITDLGRAGNDMPLTTWYIDRPGQTLQILSDAGNPGGGLAAATPVVGGTSSYQPLTGRRYQWTTDYEVARTGLTWRDDYASTVNNWVKLDAVTNPGTFIMSNSGNAFETALTTGLNAADFALATININGTYWDLPVTGGGDTYKMRVAAMTHGTLTETSSVRADYPIAIQFNRYNGDESGAINVQSAGSIALGGALINPTGITTLNVTNAAKTLTQASGSLLDAREVKLFANQIGSAADPFSVVLPTTTGVDGNLTAVARNGIYLDVNGAASIRRVEAANGDVTIAATAGIVRSYTNEIGVPSINGRITGDAITLSGGNGGVGSAFAPIEIGATVNSTQRTAGHGVVNVDAVGDIALTKLSGDLAIESIVSWLGSITLTANTGDVVSAIRGVRVDAVNRARLAQVWDDLGLGDALQAQAATIAPFETMVEAQYADYWQIRSAASVGDAGALTLTPAGLDLFRVQAAAKLGVETPTDGQITAVVQDRYDAIAAFVATTFGDAAPTGIANGEATGFFTRAEGWNYTLDTGSTLYADLTRGAGAWTRSQLENAVNGEALRPTPNTQLLLHDANLSGRDIDVRASLGSIGSEATSVVIDLTPGEALTETQKAVLASAMPGDVRVATVGDRTRLTVRRRSLLGVEATGVLSATAAHNVLLGGDGDVTIGQRSDLIGYLDRLVGVRAGGDVYLAFAGNIMGGTGTYGAAVEGASVILESATGSIGTAANPFRVAVGQLSSIRAADDVFVKGTQGDLLVGVAYAGDTLSLKNYDSILSSFTSDSRALRLQGGSIVLESAMGAVGRAGQRMQLGVSDDDGTLSVRGRSFDVYSPTRTLTLAQAVATGGSAIIGGGGDIVLTQGASAKGYPWQQQGTLDNSLNVGNLTIQTPGAITVTGGNLYAEGGDLSVVGGAITIDPTSTVGARRFLDVGGSATLRATGGDIVMGAQNTDVLNASRRLTIIASGDVTLDGRYSSDGFQIQAGGALRLGDGGSIRAFASSAVGDSQTSTGNEIEDQDAAASQSSLRGTTITFGDDATARVNFADLRVTAPGGITGGDRVWLDAQGLTLTAPSLDLGSDFLAIGGSALNIAVAGDAAFEGGVRLYAQSGDIAFSAATIDAGGDLIAAAGGNVGLTTTIGDLVIGAGGGMTAGGALTLRSARALEIGSGHLAATGDAAITAAGTFTFGLDTTLRTEISSTSSAVRINTAGFAMGDFARISGATGVSLAATGPVSFAYSTDLNSDFGDVVVTARDLLRWNEWFRPTARNVTLQGGTIDGTEGLVATIPGTLRIEATTGNAALRELAVSVGAVRLAARQTLDLSHGIDVETTVGTLSLAGGAIHFDGLGNRRLSAAGGLNIAARGTIDQRASGGAAFATLAAGGNALIRGGDVALDGWDIDTGGALLLQSSTGRLAVQASHADVGGTTALLATGNIDLTGTTVRSAGTIRVAMGNPTAGGIGAAADLESTGGSLSVTSGGSLALQDDRLVARGDVTLIAASGMTAEGGVTIAAGDRLTMRVGTFGTSGMNSFVAGDRIGLWTATGGIGLATGSAFDAGAASSFTSAGNLTLSGATFAIDGTAGFRATGDVRIEEDFLPTVAGAVTLAGRDIALSADVSITGNGPGLSLFATRDIRIGDGVSLDTDGALVMRADGHIATGAQTAIDGAAGLRMKADSATLGLQSQLRHLVSLSTQNALSIGAYSTLTGGAIALSAGSIAVDNSAVDLTVLNGGTIAVKADTGLLVRTTTSGMEFGKELDLSGGTGTLTVRSAGGLVIGDLGTVAAGGDVAISAAAIDFANNVAVDAGGALRVSATGAIDLGSGAWFASGNGSNAITGASIAAGPYFAAHANGLLRLQADGDIAIGEDAVLNSSDRILARNTDLSTFALPATPGFGIAIDAGGDVSIGSDSLSASLGGLTISGHSIAAEGFSEFFQGYAEWRAADAVTLTAAGSIRLGTIVGNRDHEIAIYSGSIALQAAGDVLLSDFTRLQGAGAVDVAALSGTLSLGERSAIQAGSGALTVAANALATDYFAALGSTEGLLDVDIGGAAAINYRASLSGGAGVRGRFGTLTMDGLSTISGGGLVDLTGGAMRLGRIVSSKVDGLAISIVSTGAITSATAGKATIVAPITGSVLLDATLGIGDFGAPVRYEGAVPIGTSSAGDVYLAPALADDPGETS